MKLLLVEDHAGLAELSSRLLHEVYDHKVEHAPNGRSALQLLGHFRPELVLVDINLPDMSGYELARQIRAHAEYDDIVLIALTGFGNIIDDSAAEAAGFDAHFRKPMDFNLLPQVHRSARQP
jgi:CheY-like chemotaxis protein